MMAEQLHMGFFLLCFAGVGMHFSSLFDESVSLVSTFALCFIFTFVVI
jgi:hypothetical protein